MLLLAGLRYVGKTTLAMELTGEDDRYYNWDKRADRKAILAAEWPIPAPSLYVRGAHRP